MAINCPNCKIELEFPEESIGANVKCGSCGEKFQSIDAVYAKGMEYRIAAQRLKDEGKEAESIANWNVACQYFMLAGNSGHANAQYQVGWICELGLGVDKDPEMAVEWYRAAVDNKDRDAMYQLALCYERGAGVEKNSGEAARLMQLAVAAGHPGANPALARYSQNGGAASGRPTQQDVRMPSAPMSANDDSVAEYVLPDGAKLDKPSSLTEITEDNPFMLTDGFVSTKLTCRACGAQFPVAYRKSVNLTENATVKYAILDGSYFKFTCPHCKQSALFCFRMAVYDTMKRYFIRSFDNLNSLLAIHNNHSTLQGSHWGFPDEFLPLVRHRLAMGVDGLREKIRIFDEGLDDYPIECVKNVCLIQLKLIDKVDAIYFAGLENDKLSFVYQTIDGNVSNCGVYKQLYDAIVAQYAEMGTFSEGVFRYVDRSLMFAENGDVRNWWKKDSPPPKRTSTEPEHTQRPLQAGDSYTLRTGSGIEIVFRWCPPGRFSMGDALGSGWGVKPRVVTLTRGFWIAETPITNAQYGAVMGRRCIAGEENLPVTNVSWKDCMSFCNGLSALLGASYKMDLPTEAQWEYAARAGTNGDFGTNYRATQKREDDEAVVGQFAWTQSNSGNHAHPVGQKRPNGWGIYDMLGNVYEYVKDTYTDNMRRLEENTTDPCILNVKRNSSGIMRGGCYYKDGLSCSVWERREVHKEGIYHIGFRTVLVAR